MSFRIQTYALGYKLINNFPFNFSLQCFQHIIIKTAETNNLIKIHEDTYCIFCTVAAMISPTRVIVYCSDSKSSQQVVKPLNIVDLSQLVDSILSQGNTRL